MEKKMALFSYYSVDKRQYLYAKESFYGWLKNCESAGVYQRKYKVNFILNKPPQIFLDFLELRAAVSISWCFVVR